MPFVTRHMSNGIKLHKWHLDDPKHPVDDAFIRGLLGPRGAYIMGRNIFGPVRGEWGESDWRGWWGPEPPCHAPVFVLTRYAHEPIEMEGGTIFHFVDGFDDALATATKVAGDLPIDVAGGASTVQQALRAGYLNELVLDIVPCFSDGANGSSTTSHRWQQNRSRSPLRPSPPMSSTASIPPRSHPTSPHGRSLDHAH